MNIISTKYGDLLPCSGASDYRKKNRCAVYHYESGSLRSVYLDEPQVLKFPSGEYQTELITFYENGNVKRVFPLYGQISAYWSVEEEMAQAPYYDFTINGKSFRLRPQCLMFYPSGKLRSITLWPGDTREVDTPSGTVKTGLGVELYESGKIRSIEPKYDAFFYRKLKLHAENGSLKFTEDGVVMKEDQQYDRD